MILLLPILSAILMRLAYPPLSLTFFSWWGLTLLFLSIFFAKSYKKVALYSFLFGFVYFGLLFLPFSALFDFVPAELMSLGMVLFALTQACFIIVAGLLMRFFFDRFQLYGFIARVYICITLPSIWVILEWVRSLGTFGNTLGVLAYAHYLNIPFLQLASLGGSYLLSWCVVCVNAVITLTIIDIVRRRREYIWQWLLFWTSFVAIIVLLGLLCRFLLLVPTMPRGERQVSIFQPAVPQNEKLDDRASNTIKHMVLEHVREYSQARKTDLIVLPETLVPEFLLLDKGFMFSLRDAVDATVIFGSPRFKNRGVNNDYCNAVLLMNKYGDVTPLHDKKYLVPFGEYIPYRSLIYGLIAPTGFLETEYSKGEDNHSIASYATSICFESTLPYQIREQVNSGGRAIVVITNDAWYKKTEMLEIHLACAVMRAAENNRYLIQAANTGVSAIIDNHGRILGRTKIDARQWLEGRIEQLVLPTPYTLLGETTVYVSFVILALMGYLVLLSFATKGPAKIL